MIRWYKKSHSEALIFIKVVDYGQYGDTKSQNCSFLVNLKFKKIWWYEKRYSKMLDFLVKLKIQNPIVAFFSDMKLDTERCFYLVWVAGEGKNRVKVLTLIQTKQFKVISRLKG